MQAFLPGVAPGSVLRVLRELRRHSLIQIPPDQIVRRLTTRPAGLTAANIAQASSELQQLASTIVFNLKNAETPRLHFAIKDHYRRETAVGLCSEC